MPDWIRLSAADLFLLWWANDLGEPPLVLDLPRPGRTPRERAEHAADASDALLARGLGTLDRPAAALLSVLRRLAGDGTTLDLRVFGADGPRYGFGAMGGREAAVAIRTGDDLRLGAVTPGGLVAALLGELEPLPAAPGLPVNVTVEDYANACGAGETGGPPAFVRALRGAGLREPDAVTLSRALAARTGGGQLGGTDRSGRAPCPVTWVDTAAGRYALRRHGQWVSVTPAEVPRLAAMAADLTG